MKRCARSAHNLSDKVHLSDECFDFRSCIKVFLYNLLFMTDDVLIHVHIKYMLTLTFNSVYGLDFFSVCALLSAYRP